MCQDRSEYTGWLPSAKIQGGTLSSVKEIDCNHLPLEQPEYMSDFVRLHVRLHVRVRAKMDEYIAQNICLNICQDKCQTKI